MPDFPIRERIKATSLLDLPPEILAQIISHTLTARSLRDLCLTCRDLRTIVETHGWRTFVERRFPSFDHLPLWKESAKRLTSLSRAFDRKSLIAWPVKPKGNVYTLPGGQCRAIWDRAKGQTMGYQPVIDSYEICSLNEPVGSQQVLAWGAGCELVVRPSSNEVPQSTEKFHDQVTDHENSKQDWIVYKEKWHTQGRDDITTVNLLRPYQLLSAEYADCIVCIVGRASGELSLIKLASNDDKCLLKTFDTAHTTVRAAHLSPSTSPVFAACLGSERVALYPTVGSDTSVLPISETPITQDASTAVRTCSTHFLNENTLAVGRGISNDIVHVYAIQPDGLSRYPLRKFGTGLGQKQQTAAYCLVGVPNSVSAKDSRGDLFFSGGYDGNIRLHDMRCALDVAAMFSDPTHDAPIFSMSMVGRERIIAGTAMHSLLKVFDLRMTGGRNYSYLDISQRSNSIDSEPKHGTSKTGYLAGWNLYTSPRSNSKNNWRSQSTSSPIYSISRPSSSSSSIYIGLEGSVLHVDMVSMADRFVTNGSSYNRKLYALPTKNHRRDSSTSPMSKNLAMYLQVNGFGVKASQALLQRVLEPVNSQDFVIDGLDERWQLLTNRL